MSWTPWKSGEMAARIARDIPDGSYVNLGIGRPEEVANHIPSGKELVFQSENGFLGMGPAATGNQIDYEIINAGKKPVTAMPGASIFHHADSFAMIRGGHLDVCVLGGFQVGRNGDLANWSTGEDDAIPAVGGAMDLGVGAKKVFVLMTHTTKEGEPKIVDRITYPATAIRAVTTVYTDLAIIDIKPDGVYAREIVEGLSFDELQARTGTKLTRH
ncbi:MAG: 3-oxoacid CoA-transferase subunit B [Hyphomicrobiaceae bacterium]|nr:3-oxoacid CoA-transferase subunit B [Hyphomicrobiaceae bacterium]